MVVPMTRTVLIVEDSPQMASNLEIALLGVADLEVRIANSGAEALGVLQDSTPVAAVITDLEMPKMDGYELIAWLRAEPRYSRTPIIVSSGSTDPESPSRAIGLGADAYFAKPYSPAELRRKLEGLLRDKTT